MHKPSQPPFGNAGFEHRQAWAPIPARQLPRWVILGKLHTSLSLLCQRGMAFVGWPSGFRKSTWLVFLTSLLRAPHSSEPSTWIYSFSPINNSPGRDCSRDVESQAQRDSGTCPGPHSKCVVDSGFESRCHSVERAKHTVGTQQM